MKAHPKGKRLSNPKARPGELRVQFGQRDGERDLFFCWGGEGARRADANLIMQAFNTPLSFGKTLREELVERGYDITTLRLTIARLDHETVP